MKQMFSEGSFYWIRGNDVVFEKLKGKRAWILIPYLNYLWNCSAQQSSEIFTVALFVSTENGSLKHVFLRCSWHWNLSGRCWCQTPHPMDSHPGKNKFVFWKSKRFLSVANTSDLTETRRASSNKLFLCLLDIQDSIVK